VFGLGAAPVAAAPVAAAPVAKSTPNIDDFFASFLQK
jgi:hypothetical protein